MQVPYLELKTQFQALKPELDQALAAVFEQGQFVGGQAVKTFESDFSTKCEVNHTVSCGNATDGLYIALKSLGIGKGDEVILPALTWISDSEAISLCGAKPVFVDVEPDYYGLDSEKIESKITSTTRAILPVHLFGQVAQIDKIIQIATKHRLSVVEDCAQAHFAEFNKQKAGTFGQIGVFSFYPTKNLGAYGDAGCLVTQNQELAQTMRRIANHGALEKDDHEFEGINSRMDTIQAAILTQKLRYIDRWNAKRNIISQWYIEGLDDLQDVTLPKIRPGARHIFHIFAIRCENRDQLKEFLHKSGIQTQIHYPRALPFLKPYESIQHSESEFPIASRLQNELLSLPMYPELSRQQVGYVCDTIRLFYQA
jgi:dTDP-4-amino-4,6-dideoxygalactose transaminase